MIEECLEFKKDCLPKGISLKIINIPNLKTEETQEFRNYLKLRRDPAFIAGRLAAHQALDTTTSHANFEILIGERGEPIWQKDIIGSISHCKSLAIATVAKNKDYKFIGIDIEEIERDFSSKIINRICSEQEKKWCEENNEKIRTLMIFSLKEAIYKALYPICKKFFGFKSVEIIYLKKGTFSVQLLEELCPELPIDLKFIAHCYCYHEQYILSLVTFSNSSL